MIKNSKWKKMDIEIERNAVRLPNGKIEYRSLVRTRDLRLLVEKLKVIVR